MLVADERKSRILTAIARLEAYHEIQNQMGRLVIAANQRQPEAVLASFALDRPDVSLEYADEGRFVGPEAVTTIIKETLGQSRPGEMSDVHLTTPMIEVADDLASARAVWWSPGIGARLREGEDPEALWLWGFFAADLVPAAETWTIWHLHYFRFIKCSYDKGWVEDTSMINRPNTPMHPMSSPTTYHNPYSPLTIRDGIPAAPRPYPTYDGMGWMLDRDKTR